jgi:polyhydroxyalkanoate synthesis regulator protein
MAEQSRESPIIVKRYAGGRLYDATVGRYVTIGDLTKWACGGIPFVVLDAETGKDITNELMR